MSLPGQSDSFKDESYPDGSEWRCDECGSPVDDSNACAKHPEANVMRVARRITFGPGDVDYRDVVVEHNRLVRVKRDWVPDWLWRAFCIGNLATFTPWKEILTRRVAA